jgi:hypothetical protein
VTPLDAERAVIGALLTGALRHADMANAPDGLGSHLRHRRVIDVLLSILEARQAMGGQRRGTGIDWRLAERVCLAARVWPLGVLSVEPPELCGLLRLAREAPRRSAAIEALGVVIQDARHRVDMLAERRRLRVALDDCVREAVTGYLSAALVDAREGGQAELRAERARWSEEHREWVGRTVWAGADVIRGEIERIDNMTTVTIDED